MIKKILCAFMKDIWLVPVTVLIIISALMLINGIYTLYIYFKHRRNP